MCDIWPYVARVPSTFDDHIFVLVAVQQLERLSNLEEIKQNKTFALRPVLAEARQRVDALKQQNLVPLLFLMRLLPE